MAEQHDDGDDIEIRVVETPADLRRLVVLLNQVWGTMTPLIGVELLRALGHAGGYVAGAFSDNRMVGGSLGFLGRHDGELVLHSHVTGILPGVRQTGLGRQMKLHQREWAAEQGLDTIVWTFDPLVRRNAWFNIGVLGATRRRLPRRLLRADGRLGQRTRPERSPARGVVDERPASRRRSRRRPCRRGRSPCRPRTTSSCCAAPTRRGVGVATAPARGARRPAHPGRDRRRVHASRATTSSCPMPEP